MIYYTSDLHLGNNNIIGYENRPYKSVEEMDKALIDNWNSQVTDEDTVYVLGDFCFKGASKAIEYLKQLNGNIHLIRGNHDFFMGQQSFYDWLVSGQPNDPIVETDEHYAHIKDGEHEVILCHYPILYWEGMDDRGSIHLYGHMHSRPAKQHPHPMAFNVGVDVNNYMPVTLEELLERKK